MEERQSTTTDFYSNYWIYQTWLFEVASYPGLPMFFNVHEKNREGLVDFHAVMDVVCDDTDWHADY